MSENKHYLFQSKRLGFRNWIESDIQQMAEINADARVMAYFPNIKTMDETREFILRMQQQFSKKGFCYFAVDKLENGEFIGFIGLSEQT
jgi:RimJ/RimL family protein N-acetyltransferase